ncbi:MAG: patatin-like phospholipase family protein [Alphaproteobacteria bacterium]|nr:patatin-like phospholipase family protein [Alphaproteobacteria bacterium]
MRQIAPAQRRGAGTRTISLALQGGGAHGAFTWGVLDRLLGNVNLDSSPAYQAFDLITRLLSPYQLNPFDLNSLRDVVLGPIDFERLRREHPMQLFVSTTNVRTGKIRVFRAEEVSADVLMASACLPHLFRAVEIDGEPYWDGGFMGNPAMFPLIYNCRADDIVLVEVNPIRIAEVPSTARAIMDRMNTISFNATMMREMRNIAFVTQLLEQHRLIGRSRLRKIHFHMIQAEEAMAAFGASSKLNIDPHFLDRLFRLGRDTAQDWLDDTYPRLGHDTTIDMHKLFF